LSATHKVSAIISKYQEIFFKKTLYISLFLDILIYRYFKFTEELTSGLETRVTERLDQRDLLAKDAV
jgi:hypothetical protein